MAQYINQPAIYQKANFGGSNDPLNVMDSQELLDTGVDPLGALDSPHGGFQKSPREINAARLSAKMQNSFGLASEGNFEGLEIARSSKLKSLG